MTNEEADEMLRNNDWSKWADARELLKEAFRRGTMAECNAWILGKESAYCWRVRWETPDGMMTFSEIHNNGHSLSRSRVEAWAAEQVLKYPEKYARVDTCYAVTDEP